MDYYTILERMGRDIFACLGPGHSERVYQNALIHELADAGISFESERDLPITYKGRYVGTVRADLILNNEFVLELKAVLNTPHDAEQQCRTYMRLTHIQQGMVINFPTRESGTLYFGRVQ